MKLTVAIVIAAAVKYLNRFKFLKVPILVVKTAPDKISGFLNSASLYVIIAYSNLVVRGLIRQ